MRRLLTVAMWAYSAGVATPYVLEHLAARAGGQQHRRNLALVTPIPRRHQA